MEIGNKIINFIRRDWNILLEKVKALYKKNLLSNLSKIRHVKSNLNIGGPPSKPKYFLMIDSAQVPWGKGEKNQIGVK